MNCSADLPRLLCWFAGGLDPSHQISAVYAWHGRLMVVAWSLLLPLGMLIARYYKITPSQPWPRVLDNRLWWHLHLLLQVSGILLMTIALGWLWRSSGGSNFGHTLHATLGWLVALLAYLQVLGGFLRGTKGGPSDAAGITCDHYAMTPRRILFERVHKSVGYLSLALALVVTGLGLALAVAPPWMWFLIALWWVLMGMAAFRLQRAGRCIDTYQAIWGPDLKHPGNRIGVIGVGVRRHSAEEDRERSPASATEADASTDVQRSHRT